MYLEADIVRCGNSCRIRHGPVFGSTSSASFTSEVPLSFMARMLRRLVVRADEAGVDNGVYLTFLTFVRVVFSLRTGFCSSQLSWPRFLMLALPAIFF